MATVPPEDFSDDQADPESVARTICLQLLTQRARTRSELAQALARRGVPRDAADRTLSRLTEVGLVDDTALADSFAQRQHHDRGLARRAVGAKLRRRGLDEETVLAALGRIDAESEQAAAVHLVQRKLRSLEGLDSQVRARRVLGLLARRGYSADVALQVLRTVTREAEQSHISASGTTRHGGLT